MNLQGRNLSSGMQGDDVKLLHSELRKLGFDIPADEAESIIGVRPRPAVFGPATREAVLKFQTVNRLEPSGEVDEPTATAINATVDALEPDPESGEQPAPLIVRGQVRQADGSPFVGGLVRAFDKDLRNEEPLGEPATTDQAGRYEITYTVQAFRRADKGSADLIVRVFDGPGTLPVSSPIIFNAQPIETVDLSMDGGFRGRSEYDELVRELAPVLQEVPLHELTEEDITFLVGETGLDRQRIIWLAESARRVQETALPDSSVLTHIQVRHLPIEVFYGWFRQNLPTELEALLNQDDNTLRRALEASVGGNIISAQIQEQIDLIFAHWNAFKLQRRLQPAPEGGPASLGDLLLTMLQPLERNQQAVVAEVVAEVHVDDEQFAKRLQAAGLSREQVVGVQRTLRLGDLTLQHVPLVQSLQELASQNEDASLRSLAALRQDQWLDLAYAHGTPAAGGLAEAEYAQALGRAVEAMHPTATLKARLEEGSLAVETPGLSHLPAFLAKNPDFDILSANLEQVAHEADFGDLDGDEKGQVVGALQMLQRLKTLSATWDESGTLLTAGLGSSMEVLALGLDGFRQQVEDEIAPERIEVIFNHAQAVQYTTLALMTTVMPRYAPTETFIYQPSQRSLDIGTKLKNYPTLRSLFGDLDRCACQHCQSVLSPAAYFVDLLEFFKARPEALQALLARRPDLVDLELSCENTETELPYIDLALEILENAVALPLAVPQRATTALLPTDPTQRIVSVPEAVREALEMTALNVGANLTAVREEQELPIWGVAQWTVTDRHRLWTFSDTRRSLLSRGSKKHSMIGPLELQLNDSEMTALIPALDGGSVPPSLETRFKAFLLASAFKRAGKNILNVASYHIEPLEPGRRWRVAFQCGTKVQLFVPKGDNTGAVQFLGGSGNTPYERTYSTAAVKATASALSAGSAGGLLLAILPEIKGFKATMKSEDEWILSGPVIAIELRYQPEALLITGLTYQSSSLDADLKAVPENRSPEAYRRLATAEFPWSLPFDLPLTETRAFLERLGNPRLSLTELLKPAARFSDDEIAREVLGLSQKQASLITTPDNSKLWARWGLDVQSGEASILDASTDETIKDAPLALLSRVSILLQQSRLSFDELRDVLQTRFVREASATEIQMRPLTECSPSKLTLKKLTSEHLDRIHRFVRLWRTVGWQVYELDLAIVAMQSSSFVETLRRLSHLKRLKQTLGLSVEVIASWWGGLGTPVYRTHTRDGAPEVTPLYERLFLNKGVRNPLDEDFFLNAARTELAGAASGKKLGAKLEFLAACLGIRQVELAQLLADLSASRSGASDDFTLSNLSVLHGAAGLSRALGLTIRDYQCVLRLTGIKPFDDTEKMLQFCEAAQFIQRSGFTVAEVVYLLRHETTPGLSIELNDERIAQILAEMRSDIQSFRQQVLDAADPLEARVQKHLVGSEWTNRAIEGFIAALSGRADVELPDDLELLGKLKLHADLTDFVRLSGRKLATLDFPPPFAFDATNAKSLYKAVANTVAGYGQYKNALDDLKNKLDALKLTTQAGLQAKLDGPASSRNLFKASEAQALIGSALASERYRKVLERIVELRQPEIAMSKLAQALGLDETIVGELLFYRLVNRAPGVDPAPSIQPLLNTAFLDAHNSVTRALFGALFDLVQSLHKAGVLLSRLGLTVEQLQWLSRDAANPDRMLGLALEGLPGTLPLVSTVNLFEDWQRTVILFELRRRTQGMDRLLTSYVSALSKNDLSTIKKVLAEGFDLSDQAEVERAATALGITSPSGYRDPLRLKELLDLLEAVAKSGATVPQMQALAAPVLDLDNAFMARTLLRAKYGAEPWYDLLKSISDSLRQHQRDMLVDYLIAQENQRQLNTSDGTRRPLRDANDLYEYFLIDVQMSPCMVTTRLLQGIGAVQLFIQRCLLNLEPGVSPSTIDAKQWAWMKNYRVWEANRKVFLYPENWLLPELRDDKTQTFRTLESALSQDEPSHDHAKETLLGYLDELNELAQISVMGMWEEQRATSSSEHALYVVGRSPNQPYRYFWRKCVDFAEVGMQWTGWERIDLDISGDHVIPFVFEGDFHIAWPIIHKTKKEGEPEKWEVQLAWVRRTTRGWSQKKVSRDILVREVHPDRDERTMFAFKAKARSTQLDTIEVECYVTEKNTSLAPPPLDRVYNKVPNSPNPTYVSLNLKVYDRYTDPETWIQVSSDLTNQELEGFGFKMVITSTNAYSFGDASGWTFLGIHSPSLSAGFAVNVSADSGMIKLKFRYKWIRAGQTAYTVEKSVSLQQGYAHYADLNLYFDRGRWADSGLAQPEKPLPLSVDGCFVFSSGYNVEYEGSKTTMRLLPPESTQAWMSGFREGLTPTGNNPWKLPAVLFGETFAERFVVIKAGASFLGNANTVEDWHFEEGRRRYFLRLSGKSLDVYPNGYEDGHLLKMLVAAGLPTLFESSGKLSSFGATDLLAKYLPNSEYQVREENRLKTNISFDRRMPYSNYNWEVFFHAPLLIADFFSKQQRFEDAQRWLHFLFDPTTNSDPLQVSSAARYWKFLPFQTQGSGQTIEQLFELLSDPTNVGQDKRDFSDQIEVWKKSPFRPHAIARMRQTAYQWHTLFTYLDNLIAWGDQLFRRDSREAINEATLLYVLAARILGPRPRSVLQQFQAPVLTYRAFAGRWDDFSNAWYAFADHPLVKVWLQFLQWLNEHGIVGPQAESEEIQALMSLGTLYFCVPQNEKILDYWKTVEDRLFNIRQCKNIEGVARELPLLAPPIDPAILIRATAAGVDIASVLADLAAPLPHHRFSVMSQKATELCAEVKALGGALLAALEKKDAEELALIRSGHEVELLTLVRRIREQQVEEACKNLDVLRASRRLAADRYRQYQRLLGKAEIVIPAEGEAAAPETLSLRLAPTDSLFESVRGSGLIQGEADQIHRLIEAQAFSLAGGLASATAGVAFLVGTYPDPTSQAFRVAQSIGHGGNAVANGLNALAGYSGGFATRDALFAGYERRRDEWAFQSNLAAKELEQIDKQIAAGMLRVAIAEKELGNHKQQILQAEKVDAFLHDKYTDRELYSWMAGQVSDVYFRSYQLAYDVAKRAERAFRYELGLSDSAYIRSGYWDRLKEGLLAGEHLSNDLKRMEVAYLEQNRREYEITKHVSLLQLDPLALITLKETGQCEIFLPEALFDLDYPGHYMRRIKSVSLTIPCVTGPYTSVNCTVTLLKNSVRKNSAPGTQYARNTNNGVPTDDNRFVDNIGAIQSIVTSNAQNDSGMFEPNLRDERYLPFEGAGVISAWRIELPKQFKQFDYDTISDVILHFRYTAREGGGLLKGAAITALQRMVTDTENKSFARLFSLKHEFPTEWHKFLHPVNNDTIQTLALELTADRFPFLVRSKKIQINQVELFANRKDSAANQLLKLWLTPANEPDNDPENPTNPANPEKPNNPTELKSNPTLDNLLYGFESYSNGKVGKWVLKALKTDIAPITNVIEDVWVVCHYSVEN